MRGADLRALRQGSGFKAYELAKALNISPATLSRYECGHTPVPKMVELSTRYLCEPKLAPRSPEDRLIEAIREVAQA